ncbi:MAG: hypothetical protein MAG795_01016 [Candidatus Woesearchaeota archaeon]|nr:hypothetical protein [Candidatus Woesearchaeota archaeon]
MYGNEFGRMAPVKEGQELDVKIEGVGEKGDGIAKVDGFVLFVPGTKEGDELRIKVTRVLRRVGFAEAIEGTQKQVSEESASEESQTDSQEDQEPIEDTEDFGQDLEE